MIWLILYLAPVRIGTGHEKIEIVMYQICMNRKNLVSFNFLNKNHILSKFK